MIMAFRCLASLTTAGLAMVLAVVGCGSTAPDAPPGAAPSGDDAGADAPGSATQADSAVVEDPDPDPVLGDAVLMALRALSPATLPAPKPDSSNAKADDSKAALLGQKVFFDPRFSGALLDGDNDGSSHALGNKGETGKVACAGCHQPDAGFSDARTIRHQTSLGAGWGLRRAPSILDVGQSTLIMWDGRRDSLYSQVFGPLESAVEWNSSRLYAVAQVFANYKTEYEAVFGALPPLDDHQRFPVLTASQTGCLKLDAQNACTGKMRGAPGDGAEYDGMTAADQTAVTRIWVNVGKAVGAYERLLSCGQSKFDSWIKGDASALGRAEQRGAALFVGKGRCADCHSGPFLSDEKFHNVGLKPEVVATVFLDADDPGASKGLAAAKMDVLNVAGPFSDHDDGRLPATVGPEYEGAFRTPRLRCVSKRPSFMHTAQLLSLEDVVAFFGRGGDGYGYPGKNELAMVGLTPRERTDLVAFLKTLDGPGPAAPLLGPP
jgi:cytochrome c peroxidase